MSGHPTRAGWFSGGQIPCDPVPPSRTHPYRLVLLGPPGVGKGTQAVLLCDVLRACHLSTGDLFRAAKCEGAASPAMQAAVAAMRRGELVSDQIVIAMVRERYKCLHCRGGFLLDGFPRTVTQAEALREILEAEQLDLDAVLCFELSEEAIVARLSGRRTCQNCHAVFHLTDKPPKTADVCDDCGDRLIQRDDDRAEAIRVRMQAYQEATRPLVDYYRQSGNLLCIPAVGTPEQIRDATIRRLQEHVASATR